MPAPDVTWDWFHLFPGTERVSLRRVDLAGAEESVTANVLALRRQLSRAPEGLPEGRAVVERRRWHLRASDLGGVMPRAGDQVIDAGGGVWVIQSVTGASFDTRYVCECQRP